MSKTTTKLQLPSPRAWRDLPTPAAAAICIFALFTIAALVGRLRSHTSAAAVPMPALAPIILIATQPAIVPPTAAPIQVAAALPRFVVCYDQPVNGAVLGPIPAPEASAIVARYGAAWVMTPWNGGYCWLRAADVGLPDVADVQPTDAPAVIYIANQPADAVPTPTSGTQVIESVPTPQWATSAPVRAEDFTAPDPKARCMFVGCL